MKKSIIFITLLLFASITTTYAQHGFGTNNPDAQAVIDASSTDMGVLIPRVALTAADNISPFASTPTTSMFVYNTATSGTSPNNVVPGYYYWNGTRWVKLLNDRISSGAILYGNTSGGATELAPGTNGHVLTLSGGLPTWVSPASTSEIVGNEVTNATDTSLHRSGGGTDADPYTLAVNQGFPFVFTGPIRFLDSVYFQGVTLLDSIFVFDGVVEFTDTVFIRATGNHGIIIENGGFAFASDTLQPHDDGSGEKWVFNEPGNTKDNKSVFVVTPTGGGTHTIYSADMPESVADGTILFIINNAATNISVTTDGFPRDGSIVQGQIGMFIYTEAGGTGTWYFND